MAWARARRPPLHHQTNDERELLRLWRTTNQQGRECIMAVPRSQEGWAGAFRLIRRTDHQTARP